MNRKRWPTGAFIPLITTGAFLIEQNNTSSLLPCAQASIKSIESIESIGTTLICNIIYQKK